MVRKFPFKSNFRVFPVCQNDLCLCLYTGLSVCTHVCAPCMYKIPLKALRISPLRAAVLQLQTSYTPGG